MVVMNISLAPFSHLGGTLALLLTILVRKLALLLTLALLLAILTTVAANEKDLCQSELKPNLTDLIEFTVFDKEKLKVKEFKIVLKEGDNFNNILTPPCDPLKFPELSVEFREEGTDHWYESKITGISDHKRSNSKLLRRKKEGKIWLKNIKGNEKLEELDYCKVYEMRLKVNEQSGEQIIKVGPFIDLFTLEELVNLDEEQDDLEREINLTYEKTENGVQISWDDVCAKSVIIYVKIGNQDPNYFETKTDLSDHSFMIETEPCNIYMFELDFFLAPDPEQKTWKYGVFYKGINSFISPPEPETFANIRMDETSKELSWDFSEYRGFSNDPGQAICIWKNGLKYKITFGTIDGQELNVLKEEDRPKLDKPYTFDILKAINNTGIILRNCGQYELKMEVSYITAMEKSMSRVFKESFNTNHNGTLVETNEDVIKFGPCATPDKQEQNPLNETGEPSSVVESKYPRHEPTLVSPVLRFLLCQYFSKEEPIRISADINIGEFNFAEGSEYDCRIKMEYKAKGGDQETLETDWSEPITLIAPGPI